VVFPEPLSPDTATTKTRPDPFSLSAKLDATKITHHEIPSNGDPGPGVHGRMGR